MSRTGSIFFWGILGWFVLASLMAIQLWFAAPHTTRSWIVFTATAPALWVLTEMIAERLWSARISQAISNHPSSAFRIAFGVAIGSAILAASLGIAWFFNIAI